MKGDRSTLGWLRWIAAAFLFATGTSGGAASATPTGWDAIVPTAVEINTAGSGTWIFTAWGWTTPTGGTLTASDLQNAIFTVSFSDPNVTVTTSGFLVPAGYATLNPGDVTGMRVAAPTADNTALDAGLVPGELRIAPDVRWQMAFSMPHSYTGSGVLTQTVDIGGRVVSYSTNVTFANTGLRYFVPGGAVQRVSAVPEAGSLALILTACFGASAAWRRPRAPDGTAHSRLKT